MTHEAYKRFVDQMVAVARGTVSADRIRARGHPIRTNDMDLPLSAEESALRDLFLRLGDGDREILARALDDERQAALHDFAAFIEWATACDDMSVQWHGETFRSSPFNSMHGDFVGRLSGDEWENA